MNDKLQSSASAQPIAEVAPVAMKPGLSETMAAQYSMGRAEFLNTIKETCFPNKGNNVSNEQLAAFLIVANEYGLNPFIRQIYAFPGSGGGIVPIVPIDGWSKIVNERQAYDGCSFRDIFDDEGQISAITCLMHRKDRNHPIEITEYLSECKRDIDTWRKWPARMLRHKAFIQAARLAFGLSNIFDPDEAARIELVGGAIGDNDILNDPDEIPAKATVESDDEPPVEGKQPDDNPELTPFVDLDGDGKEAEESNF